MCSSPAHPPSRRRFTLTSDYSTKMLRLFVGEPGWTRFNRPQDEHPSRLHYVNNFKIKA